MRVGTRELKNRLSHYLRRVRAGEPVIITDHGEPIAELRALPKVETEEAILERLAAEGILRRGTGKFKAFKLLKLRGSGPSLSEMIIADRRR